MNTRSRTSLLIFCRPSARESRRRLHSARRWPPTWSPMRFSNRPKPVSGNECHCPKRTAWRNRMSETRFRGRRAAFIENEDVRVTVLKEGGHIAEILDKQSGVNPLWIPPWPSIEPSTYDLLKHPEYGTATDARLLAGIMGHNLCLDIFGGPSEEEFQAGITSHGEGSVVPYEITEDARRL